MRTDSQQTGPADGLARYTCSDAEGCAQAVLAGSPAQAAEIYVDGSYERERTTYWLEIAVRCRGEESLELVPVHPKEPPCSSEEHAWGDLDIRGHGAGIIATEECTHCGMVRVEDRNAQCSVSGRQGLRGITYSDEP